MKEEIKFLGFTITRDFSIDPPFSVRSPDLTETQHIEKLIKFLNKNRIHYTEKNKTGKIVIVDD